MVATKAAALLHVVHVPPRNAYPLSQDPHKTPVYPTSHPCGKHATSFKHGRWQQAYQMARIPILLSRKNPIFV